MQPVREEGALSPSWGQVRGALEGRSGGHGGALSPQCSLCASSQSRMREAWVVRDGRGTSSFQVSSDALRDVTGWRAEGCRGSLARWMWHFRFQGPQACSALSGLSHPALLKPREEYAVVITALPVWTLGSGRLSPFTRRPSSYVLQLGSALRECRVRALPAHAACVSILVPSPSSTPRFDRRRREVLPPRPRSTTAPKFC